MPTLCPTIQTSPMPLAWGRSFSRSGRGTSTTTHNPEINMYLQFTLKPWRSTHDLPTLDLGITLDTPDNYARMMCKACDLSQRGSYRMVCVRIF